MCARIDISSKRPCATVKSWTVADRSFEGVDISSDSKVE